MTSDNKKQIFNMMDLEGFYSEEYLDELVYEEKITRVDYIRHHSQEMIDNFRKFCKENNLQEDEAAANKFMDWLLEQEEKAHTDGLD